MKHIQETKIKNCPITGQPMDAVFSARLLNKYDVQYYYSEQSGILQTEQTYWLDEAYTGAIAATDTGILRRNLQHLLRSLPLLNVLVEKQARLQDVGGGYGILIRMFRDTGYDCYSYDKYCQNLFAGGFEPDDNFSASLLFAFEVFEHIEDPLTFLQENFAKYSCRIMIVSTQTFNNTIPDKDWWYYSFATGQHITFYQPRTLSLLAEKNNCFYFPLGSGFHLFTDQRISKLQQTIFSSRVLSTLQALYLIVKQHKLSKTQLDSDTMKKRILQG